MIRSICEFQEKNKRCGKVTRARRIHKFCREHTLTVTGNRREIPHQIKKEKVRKVKFTPAPVEVKSKKKR